MIYKYVIAPLSATGQHNPVNNFAYRNSGKRCCKFGELVWESYEREEGYRQQVELESGERGWVWEDELDRVCLTCNMVQWECDCEVLNTGE